MDSELAKVVAPLLGGSLALAGGIFTFVSSRLREAETPEAKGKVTFLTQYYLALAFWATGCVLGSFQATRLLGLPFIAISFVLHWKLFLDGPEPPSRAASANFSVISALTAVALSGTLVMDVLDGIVSIQKQTIEALGGIVELHKVKPEARR